MGTRVRRALALRRRVIRNVRRERLTYLPPDALDDLWRAVRDAERSGRPGSVIEAGCALGGSAIVLAAARSAARPLYLYDVFGMIPPPSDRDGSDIHERYATIKSGSSMGIGTDKYYGYEADLLNKVERAFRRHGIQPHTQQVHLIQGLYEQTLSPRGLVAVAHIDCDWYESVKLCLQRLWPHLAVGGVIVVDDYDHWSGCREAVDEFLWGMHDDVRIERRARLHLRKT